MRKIIFLALTLFASNIAAAAIELPLAIGPDCTTHDFIKIANAFGRLDQEKKDLVNEIVSDFPEVDINHMKLTAKAYILGLLEDVVSNGGVVFSTVWQVTACTAGSGFSLETGKALTAFIIPRNGENVLFVHNGIDYNLGNGITAFPFINGIDSSLIDESTGAGFSFDMDTFSKISMSGDQTADRPTSVLFVDEYKPCDADDFGEGFRTIMCVPHGTNAIRHTDGRTFLIYGEEFPRVEIFFANEKGMAREIDQITFNELSAEEAGVFQMPNGSWNVSNVVHGVGVTSINVDFIDGEKSTVTIRNN